MPIAGQHPLPAQQPQPSTRREPDRARRDGPVRRAGVMQVRQRTPRFAQHLQRKRNILGAEPRYAREHRFTADPPAQIAGSALALGIRGPVVIRGRHRRMIAMRQRTRLPVQPLVMRRIGRTHQRERTPKSVDHFLIVSMLPINGFVPPRPSRRQHPLLEVRRRRGRRSVIGWEERRAHTRQFNDPGRVMRQTVAAT